MKALLACACLLAAVAGHAMRVDNFMLLDQDGQAHELHYYSDAKAIVLIVQGNGCPIVRKRPAGLSRDQRRLRGSAACAS